VRRTFSFACANRFLTLAMTIEERNSGVPAPLLREDLCLVLEGLEFEGVARGVEEEHGCLFAGLAAEADVGFDHEGDARRPEPVRQRMPVVPVEDEAEMGNRNMVAVDLVRDSFRCGIAALAQAPQMSDNLVSEEIEADPAFVRTALGTAEQAAVEFPGARQIIDRESDMESWHP